MFRYPFLLIFVLALTTTTYSDSIDVLEQEVERNPGSISARKQLALGYYEMGDLDKSVNQLEVLERIAPGDDEVIQDLMSAYRMLSLKTQNQGKYPDALGYADKCIAYGRLHKLDTAPGQYQRVVILNEQGKVEQALQELAQLPSDSQFFMNAQDLIVAALLRQARDFVKQKNYNGALERIARAARIDPQKYAYLHLQTAHILAATGREERALEVLGSLARILPSDDALFQYRIGSLYKKLGKTALALDYLARVPQDSPYYERARSLRDNAIRMVELTQESQEAMLAGDLVSAIEKLREIVKLDPNQHRLRLSLARLLAQKGDQQGALSELEMLRVSLRVVSDPFYQLEMGRLYMSLEQYERSEHLLEQIPEDSDLYVEAQKLLERLSSPAQPEEELPVTPKQSSDTTRQEVAKAQPEGEVLLVRFGRALADSPGIDGAPLDGQHLDRVLDVGVLGVAFIEESEDAAADLVEAHIEGLDEPEVTVGGEGVPGVVVLDDRCLAAGGCHGRLVDGAQQRWHDEQPRTHQNHHGDAQSPREVHQPGHNDRWYRQPPQLLPAHRPRTRRSGVSWCLPARSPRRIWRR